MVWLSRLPKTIANLEVREGDNPVFTRFINGGYFRPTKILGEAGRPVRIWARARGPDSLYITRGGLLSFLTFGLFGRRLLVNRHEETDLDATRRITFS